MCFDANGEGSTPPHSFSTAQTQRGTQRGTQRVGYTPSQRVSNCTDATKRGIYPSRRVSACLYSHRRQPSSHVSTHGASEGFSLVTTHNPSACYHPSTTENASRGVSLVTTPLLPPQAPLRRSRFRVEGHHQPPLAPPTLAHSKQRGSVHTTTTTLPHSKREIGCFCPPR